MALGLDLTGSRAKVERAREHVDTVHSVIAGIGPDTAPYTVCIGEMDADGWIPLYVVPQNPPWKRRLSQLAGDVHNNLRSALDYIVAELARASGVDVAPNHKFPIYDDPQKYVDSVGFPKPKRKGALGGIKYGLAEIEALQPYSSKPKVAGNLPTDLLLHLQGYSNYDKHRASVIVQAQPLPSVLYWEASESPLEVRRAGELRWWESDREHEDLQLRFAKPPAV